MNVELMSDIMIKFPLKWVGMPTLNLEAKNLRTTKQRFKFALVAMVKVVFQIITLEERNGVSIVKGQVNSNHLSNVVRKKNIPSREKIIRSKPKT